jgi:putative membrane protein
MGVPTMPTHKTPSWILWLLLATVLGVYVWSAIEPRDRFTWLLETFYTPVAVPLLLLTLRRFPFTTLVYILISFHLCVLMVGRHYTYAEVPLFHWIRDAFGLARNHYDRVRHFLQGFVPALIVREILLRCSPLVRGKWLFFLVTCVCLAFSAAFELFEWVVAVATGARADAFLATQGDPWDTQWDMFLALVGAILAQLFLARLHDRQLRILLAPR